ncbi:MAG: hypothetical protein QOE68_4271 [Thermoanaerobaculia bacterium]|nr:hypothetical protein [Thermoanaerobaculia bacterium]
MSFLSPSAKGILVGWIVGIPTWYITGSFLKTSWGNFGWFLAIVSGLVLGGIVSFVVEVNSDVAEHEEKIEEALRQPPSLAISYTEPDNSVGCPDCGHQPISQSCRACPRCGCTKFIRGTGQQKKARCSSCGTYPNFHCAECDGTGVSTWVELKDFRSGHIDFFIRGVDPGDF